MNPLAQEERVELHPHAAGLFMLGDPEWRRSLWRGGLVVVMPFVGWHMVLGFRRLLITRLLHGPDALPSWPGPARRYFLDGIKAGCVIFAYLLPLYAVAFGLALSRGWHPSTISPWIPALFIAFPFLLPLSLPFTLLVLSARGFLQPLDSALLLAAFLVMVFTIPAAFLQVSITGRFRSAFHVTRVATFLRNHGALYARAWRRSVPIAFTSHVVLPIAPWSIVWAYCSVMFLFNEALVASGEHGSNGWIRRARADPRWAPSGRIGLRTVRDARGEDVCVLDLGAFSAPMPWRTTNSDRSS